MERCSYFIKVSFQMIGVDVVKFFGPNDPGAGMRK